MGQRFQVMISTPAAYLNKKNPNNRGREYHIFHSQWLFGASAVIFCDELIRKLQELIEFEMERMEDVQKHTSISSDRTGHASLNIGRRLYDAIRATCYHFFPDNPDFDPSGDFNEFSRNIMSRYNETLEESGIIEGLRRQDNNDGQFILYIDDNFNLSYCFWNPGKRISGRKSNAKVEVEMIAREYLMTYYPLEELQNGITPRSEKWNTVENNIYAALRRFENRNTIKINEIWADTVTTAIKD